MAAVSVKKSIKTIFEHANGFNPCKSLNLAVFIHANLEYFNSSRTRIYFHSLIKAS